MPARGWWPSTSEPHHHGGFGQSCYILPRSWIDFVTANRHRFPFAALVDGRYRPDQVDEAMADATARRVLRAAIVP